MNSGSSNRAYLVNKWASFEIKFALSKQKISSCITTSVAYRQNVSVNAARNKVTDDFFGGSRFSRLDAQRSRKKAEERNSQPRVTLSRQ